ncbi:MAG: hypothetical protein SCM11_18245 [Bacillota bacterium]|nr:hypothetical protein [Bacillota bacterium]
MRQLSPYTGSFFRTGLMIFLIVILLLCLPACQTSSQTTPATQSTTAAASPTATTAKAETGATTTTADMSKAEPLPFNDADLVITFQGQTYTLLEDASGLLLVLGEDFQYSEAESCVYDGMDKTFDYGSICVYTIPSETTDLIDGFDVYDDSVMTARNISVGASREEVLKAYGPQIGEESDLVYNTSGDISRLGDPKLTFLMENDLVMAISYYSGSNFKD